MSRRFWPRRSGQATSSSSTISAATRASRPRAPSEPRARTLFFLPHYWPDLNPIEQVFAKLKHLLRKASSAHVEATWRRVGALLDLFPPRECANYLANSGYGSV